MSKKLAIIKPAAINLPAVVPKPRKEDIINALVERARVKHAEENAKLEAQRAVAVEAFETALLAELTTNPSVFTRRVRNQAHWNPEVRFELEVLPPKFKKLRDAINAVSIMRSFDPVAIKKNIRDQLDTSGDRVQALLSNPDAVKALDATLARIA